MPRRRELLLESCEDRILCSASVIVSTAGNATVPSGHGVTTWTNGQAVELADPNLQLEPGTTNGTFSNKMDLSAFAQDGAADIAGIHYVSKNVTVGTVNPVALQAGDVLLTTKQNETLGGVAVTTKDVVLFRPTTAGDYSSGTFSILMHDPGSNGNNIRDFALVENSVTVGGTTLQAGDFLMVFSSATYDKNVTRFQPTTMNTSTTGGTLSTLIDGSAAGIGIGQQIFGLDLVQQDVTVGGRGLQAGQLLIALNGNDTVGTNNLSVTQYDIFALTATATGAGTSSGSASLVFQGSDIGLSTGSENLDAISLKITSQAPVVTLPGAAVNYTENGPATVLDATATVTDPDSTNFTNGTLTVDFSANGTANDRLAIRNEGTGAGQIGVSGSNVTFGGTTIGTFTGGTGTTPLVISFNSLSTPASAQALARNITYSNVSDAPSTLARTVRFVVTDGGGGTSTAATKTVNVTAVNDAPRIDDVSVSLGANAPNGSAAGNINDFNTGADTDVDGQALTYSITGGNTSSAFAINASTGVITVNNSAALDFNTNPVFNLTIQASDGTLTDTANVTINLVAGPLDGGPGAIAVAKDNNLYSVNLTTGKATLLFTDTDLTTINSVGYDSIKGIYYYADSANGSKAIYGWDARAGGARFVVTSDVTTYGVSLPSAGMGAAGGDFNGGSYYFSTEGGGVGNDDQLYKVDFVAGSNGRTVSGITLISNSSIPGANEFGDFIVNSAAGKFYSFDSGTGVAEYNLVTAGTPSLTFVQEDANSTVAQAAYDRFGNMYVVNTGFKTYDPAGAGTFGTAKTMTTDGTTAFGAATDGAAYISAEGSIGDNVFYDENSNGTQDAGDNGIGGLTVALYYDLNGDGIVNGSDSLIATTTTAADGSYAFNRLLPDTYVVKVTDPANILNGGASTTGGFTQAASLTLVGQALTKDFGFQDSRPTVSVSNVSVTEGADSFAQFTVSLSRTFSQSLTVNLALASGTATGGGVDYGTSGAGNLQVFNGTTWVDATSATLAAGTTSVLVRTPIVNDSLDEAAETFTLTATRTSALISNTSATGTATITDDDATPSLAINSVTFNEATGNAIFTVTLSAASGQTVTVGYATGPGTATAPSDYTTSSGTLTFTPGTLTQTISVPIINDTVYEGSETFNVILSSPSNATIATGTGVGTIKDDGTGTGGTNDDRPVNTLPATYTTLEDTTATLSGISISNPDPTRTVTVSLSVGSGVLNLNTGVGGGVTSGQIAGNGTGTVTITASVNAINATLANATGLRFVPVANANGTVSFSMTTTDGIGVDTDTSAITVTPVNDAPAGTDKTITTNEDTGYTFTAADFGFSDPNDTPANAFQSVIITTLPTTGSLTLSGVAVTAGQTITVANIPNLVWTPAANANGTGISTFTFQAKDNGGTVNGGVDTDQSPNTITFNVTAVNDAPVGTDKTITTNEDTGYTFTAADFGFSDPNDTPANGFQSVIITTLPTTGSLTLSGVAVTAGQTITVANIPNLVWTPAANANGAGISNFTFQVKDNGGTVNGGVDTDQSPNTITFNVTPVNDAPVGTDKTITTNEDTGYTFTATDFGFSDPNDTPANAFQSVIITTLPTTGSLKLSGVAVTAGQTITVANIPNLVWTPAASANGTGISTFTFQVKDNGGTVNGGVDTDQSPNTITFNVTPVNDAPVNTISGPQTTPEDTALAIPGVSVSDVDDDPLTTTLTITNGTATVITGGGAIIGGNGTNTVVISGTAAQVNAALAGLTYANTPDYNGSAQITVATNDGTVTTTNSIAVTVTPVADITNDSVATAQNANVSFNVITGTGGATSDSFEGTPAVTAINGAAFTPGNPITITGGTITVATNGQVTFVPTANVTGPTSFTYTVASGGVTEMATVSLNVIADVAPVNTVPGAQTAVEDTAKAVAGVSVADSDSASLTTTLTIANGTATVTAGGGATIGGNGTNTITISGTAAQINAALTGLTYTNTPDYYGSAQITVATSDGILTDTDTVAITVTPVADITSDTITTDEDTSATFNVITGTGGATADTFEGTPSVTAINGAAFTPGNPIAITGGAITVAANGQVSFAPSSNFNGPTSFTYTVTSGGVIETATVNIGVTPVNDAPAGTDKTITTLEDTGYTFTAADFGFGDPNDTPANTFQSVIVTTLPTTGSFTLSGVAVTAGQTITVANIPNLVWTPAANANGTGISNFTFQVKDNGGTANGGVDTDQSPNTITFDVTPVNDAAVNTVPGPQTATEDTAQPISGVSVSDVDGDPLTTTLTITNGTANVTTGGGATIGGDGTNTITISGTAAQINAALTGLTYTNTPDYNGPAQIAVATNDGTVTTTDTIAITVTPVADITNDTITTNEDTSATFNVITGTGGAAADSFEGSPSVTAINGTAFTPGNPIAITGGTITVAVNGQVTFAPAADFNGPTSFTYTVTSGGVAETATVNIGVTPVNDAPVNTVPGPQSATEDTAQPISGVSVSDVDGDPLTTTLTITNGTANVTTGGGATIGGNSTNTITISGTAAQINSALSGLTYTNTPDYNGPAQITVATNDGTVTTTDTIGVTVTPVADITDDTITTNEDTSASFNVITGTGGATADSFEGTPSVTAINGAAFTPGNPIAITGGTITVAVNGQVTFAPTADFNGPTSFTYTVTSGGVTETATVNIGVTPVNDAPVNTVPGPQSAMEDTAQPISGVSASDVDGDPLTTTLTITNGTANVTTGGGATIGGNGTNTITISGTAAQINAALTGLSYTNTPDYNGPAQITVATNDGTVTTTDTIGITVTPVADITNDTITTNEDTSATFNVITGTGGATADSFEGTPAVTAINGAAFTPGNPIAITGGTITVATNGQVTFMPTADFNGPTSFTYTVTSGGVTETATVNIGVTPVNDAPVNTVPGSQTATEDTAQPISGVSVSDVDGDPLTTTLTITNGTANVTTGGGATIGGNSTNTITISGTAAQINAALTGLTYTNTPDYNGPAQIAVATNDGTVTTTDTIAITVTPVADITNDTITTNEDTSATFNVITGTGGATADSFEGTPTVTAINGAAFTPGNPIAITGGTITVATNGQVTFTPTADFNGPTSFTYTVTSGGVTETATVNIGVTPVNDAPVNTVPGPQTATEDTAQPISGVSVSDVDGDPLTTTLTITNGTANVTTGGGATIGGNGTNTITISGTAAQINAALTGLTYTNTPDYNGPAQITVATNDGTATTTDTIAITVTPVADITNDTITTNEDTSATFNVITGTGGATADSFEGTPAVTAINGTAFTPGNPIAITGGTITVATNGQVTFTPTADFNGPTSFTYTVTSGGVTETATVNIGVTPVNDAPVNTVPGPQTAAEDTAQPISGVSVSDVDGDPLATTLTITNGTANVTTGGGATIGGDGTNTITISGTAAQINAALTGLTYTNTPDYNGPAQITVATNDGTATTTDTIAITVTPVADITNDTITTNEDTSATFNVITGTGGATADTFEGAPSVTAINGAVFTPGNPITITGGTITVATNGQVTFAPAADFNGPTSFTYTVTSGGVTETATVNIGVTPVNDAPAGTDKTITTLEDTGYTFTAADFGFSDPNDTPANAFQSVIVTTLPTTGSFTLSGVAVTAGQTITVANIPNLVWTPAANANGTGISNFTFQVKDNGGTANGGVDTDQSPNTITFDVTPVNDAAVNTVPGPQTATEDTAQPISGVSVSDVDGDPLTTTLTITNGTVNVTTGGGATIGGDGTNTITISGTAAQINAALTGLTYTNTPDYNGPAQIAVATNDGTVTTTDTIAITVTQVADITNDTITTNEDTSATFNVITGTGGAAADSFEGTPTVTAINGAAFTPGNPIAITGGTITVATNGQVTFTPTADFNGPTSFTYTVTSGGTAETATVNIGVTPVNDAPVNTVPGSQTATEDTAQPISGVSVSDVDGDPLTTTLTITNGTANVTTGGGATIGGNGTNTITISGTAAQINAALTGLAYTNTPDYNGPAQITVATNDGTVTTTDTIGITVTPVADITNDTITTNEDTSATFNVITGTGGATADSFEGTPSVTAINGAAFTPGNPIAITGGTITVAVNGQVTFAPTADFNGPTSFTYTVTSGGVTETATVNIGVTPVNDAPVNTVPGPQSATEDTAQPISGVSVSDVDGDPLTTTLTITNGTANVTTGGGATIGGNGTNTITISGTAAQINAALTGLTYTNTPDYNGPAQIAVATNDGTVTTTSTIAITVNPVADITNDTITTNEDTPATFNVITGTGGATADTFEGTPVVTAINGNVFTPGNPISITGGTITVAANGQVTFTPTADFNGPTSFTYTVTSGGTTETATVNIGVTPVNDAPVNTVPGSQTATEDTVKPISGVSVSDVDGDPLTTTLTITNGTANVTTGGGATIGGNGTNTITISGTAAQINAALTGLTYTNTPDYNGPAQITVATNDGTVTTTDTIGVTVTPVADITNDTITTNEDTSATFNVITGTGGATADSFEGTPAVTAINGAAFTPGNPITITGGTITVASNGQVTFVPNANFNGPTSFTYTMTSDGTTETATVNIGVTPVDDPPVANNDKMHARQNKPATGNVLTNDTDIDGGALTVTDFTFGKQHCDCGNKATIAGVGTLVINSDGTFTFTPVSGYCGSVPVAIYSISDGNGGNASATLKLGPIAPVEQAPPALVAPPPEKFAPPAANPAPAPFVFAFDTFHNFSTEETLFNTPLAPGAFTQLAPIDNARPAMLPLAPIYSGEADPGSTLVIELYNSNGVRIATQMVMADAGGNWLANFGGASLKDAPSDVRITQVGAPYAFGAGGGHNLRTYYAPAALNPGHFLSQTTSGGVGEDDAPLLGGLDLANPIQLGNVKYGGEFLPSEGVASGN